MKIIRSLALLLVLGITATFAQSGGSVLTWTAPTAYTDGATIPSAVTLSYNVYQGTASGNEVLLTTVSALTYSSTALTGCWKVTAIAAGVEGPASLEVCKRAPGAPGLSVK